MHVMIWYSFAPSHHYCNTYCMRYLLRVNSTSILDCSCKPIGKTSIGEPLGIYLLRYLSMRNNIG